MACPARPPAWPLLLAALPLQLLLHGCGSTSSGGSTTTSLTTSTPTTSSTTSTPTTSSTTTTTTPPGPYGPYPDAVASAGCGKAPPLTPGKSVTFTMEDDGHQRSYVVHLPSSYNNQAPLPLVLDMHGWGRTAAYEAQVSGMAQASEEYNFIVVFPEGSNDMREGWQSFNVAGASHATGPEGPTCTEAASAPGYCYRSCRPCQVKPQCAWATCLNDVTSSGVGVDNVTGFLPRIFETLGETLCIDESRQYATGKSNGAMAAYQLGVSMADKLAAIAPISGSFQRGFRQVPQVPIPVMDIHGSEDTTIPANSSVSSDGYYYTPVPQIISNWSLANGCTGDALSQWRTSLDGVYGLHCIAQGDDCAAPAVRCSWDGGHLHFGNDPAASSRLVWEFLSRFRHDLSQATKSDRNGQVPRGVRGSELLI